MTLATDIGVTGHKWADVLILAAAVLTACGVIWRKVIRPVAQGAVLIEQVLPVLVDIARQFHPNGGHSLKDSIDSIKDSLEAVVDQQRQQAAKLEELHEYAHETRHEQSAQIQGLAHVDEALNRKLDALVASDDVKIRKLDEIAAKQPPTEKL